MSQRVQIRNRTVNKSIRKVVSTGMEKRISDEVQRSSYLKATRSEAIEIMLEMLFERFTDLESLTEQLERRLIAKRKGIE
ncbi:MAG: hypothetical protein KAT65_18905 [Methanophagales archaeon]|nr:hypothetical protein [Methanophagales archaeon]